MKTYIVISKLTKDRRIVTAHDTAHAKNEAIKLYPIAFGGHQMSDLIAKPYEFTNHYLKKL